MTTPTVHPTLPAGKMRGGTIKRNLLSASTVIFVIVLALVGTGTTYALLNSAAAIRGSTITSGSTSVTVNGGTHSTVATDLSLLAPGESTVAPVTLANTGTTPVTVFVSSATVDSQSHGLADFLRLRFAPAEACVAGSAGASAAPLVGFTTTPLPLQTGASAAYCLEIFLAADAPASVQGGTTAFALILDAHQVPR